MQCLGASTEGGERYGTTKCAMAIFSRDEMGIAEEAKAGTKQSSPNRTSELAGLCEKCMNRDLVWGFITP